MDKIQAFLLPYTNKVTKYLKSIFSTTDVSLVSLDVGSAYVKAISFKKEGQRINITGFTCEKIKASGVKDAVKEALLKLPAGKKELALSLSGKGVILRYVSLPLMSEQDLSKSMVFEIEKHIPLKKEEINYDYVILKKDVKNARMLVLITAAKKELIDSKIALCREFGYHPRFIEVDSLSMLNYFDYTIAQQKGVVAIINLGATHTCVDIVEDGVLVLSRDISTGGSDFTQRISETTGKDISEAEEIKINALDDNLVAALEPVFNSLAGDFKASFDFYESQAGRSIDKAYLSGGASKLKGLLIFLKEHFIENVEIISFNPDKFYLAPSLDSAEFKENFNCWTIALGMACR